MEQEKKYIILQCPRCYNVKHWYREQEKKGPGFCICKSKQFWKVLKEEPKKIKGGYVIVMSDKGTQRLYGPSFIEHPDAWIKDEK